MSPVFEYKARKKEGGNINGTTEADNSTAVANQLKERGYYVTAINEKRKKLDLSEYVNLTKKVKIKDLAVFSQQFAAMINAGVSLVETLEILQKQIEHPRLKEVVTGIQQDVETGTSLSEAMQKYPDVFPPLYCQLVRAGEEGGVLDQVLDKVADHYERQAELSNMVKSALYYPMTILVVAIAVVVFLIMKVVPQFVGMFEDLGAQLPLPTRILLGTSNFMLNYWWVIVIGLLAAGLLLYRYKKTPKGSYKFDKYILKIPVIGDMMQKIYLSRFSSTLAILLESGVDMLSSLSIVEGVVGNKVFARALTDTRVQVREGAGLSEPLSQEEVFPAMITQMLRVGEESGAIDDMLYKVSQFYDKEVESSVEASISLIEPVMIVFLAVLVGFVAVSIVTPMFDIYQQF